MVSDEFHWKTPFAETIFQNKYAQGNNDTWPKLCKRLIDDVCGTRKNTLPELMTKEDRKQLLQYMIEMKFIPGGRYLYYAGRPLHFYNNCFCLKAEEDTREEWGNLIHRVSDCLMSGGGIGVDYSLLRPKGAALKRTGGTASGPLPLMNSVNEYGRNVMQGGSRRSAMLASLNWQHGDIQDFLTAKNWSTTIRRLKGEDFNFPAPLDMTNISINWDTDFIKRKTLPSIWYDSIKQMCHTGEPGHAYNFGENENDTLRNAPVSGNTYVLTSTGYKKVIDIVGTPIVVWTGKQWATTIFNKTRELDSVVTVEMTGRRKIVCSKDHPFITEDGERIEAQNLIIKTKLKSSPVVIKTGKHVVDAYLLAFIYGDGTLHQRYPRAEVTLCGEKEKLLPYLYKTDCVVTKDKKGLTRIYYKNHDIFRAREKATFPEDVYSWDYESRVDFLSGLLDADGYADTSLRLGCKHFEFLTGVARLCDSLGLYALINKGSKSGYTGAPTWTLSIRGACKDVLNTKRLQLKNNKFLGYHVVSIKDAGVEDVYCCNVGVPEHTFVAECVCISNCGEFTSESDSDVCNLGSINLGNIKSIEDLTAIINLSSKFLVCGTIRGDVPYAKVQRVREQNRKIGLGLMGMHEWLLKRKRPYEVGEELKDWLSVYKNISESSANEFCDVLSISRPVKYRAIAPAGTIGILASTSTGIEPLFAVAYKRRYLEGSSTWKYQYVVDATSERLIQEYDIDPDSIETASDLAKDPERRIKFQADVQDYVDMGISSTLNLPTWGTKYNNEDTCKDFAKLVAKYCHRLRGLTTYPNGARGGQPLTRIFYKKAMESKGMIFDEDEELKGCAGGGSCGI